MQTSSFNFYLVLISSFLLALLLSVYPLPMSCRSWRPEFVLLVAIYWILAMPFSISLLALCGLGLFQDLLEGTPFGQHSLGLIVVTYLCLFSYQRVRNFNLVKQMISVLVMLTIAQLSDNWVQGMAGQSLLGIEFVFAALSSALIWPAIRYILDYSCNKLHLLAN